MRIVKKLVTFYDKILYSGKCRIGKKSNVHHCSFEGKNRIWNDCNVSYSVIGYGTYIGNGCKFAHAKVGRFCSISDDVRLIAASHPIKGFVSTSPAFYSTVNFNSLVKKQKYEEYLRDGDGYSVQIGSDVWIGNRVLIKGGIHIGDGAVIGMGAVVTKDVPPYAIVGGVPAKIIGYRFSQVEREALLKSKWWDREISWIVENADLFETTDNFV